MTSGHSDMGLNFQLITPESSVVDNRPPGHIRQSLRGRKRGGEHGEYAQEEGGEYRKGNRTGKPSVSQRMKELCIHGGAARLEYAARNDERLNPTCRVHNTSPLLESGLPLSFTMFSTIGPVLAAEAEEGQDTLLEEAEARLQTRVRVLCALFRGRPEVAVVHRARAEPLLCPVRVVRREAEAVLRQP